MYMFSMRPCFKIIICIYTKVIKIESLLLESNLTYMALSSIWHLHVTPLGETDFQ